MPSASHLQRPGWLVAAAALLLASLAPAARAQQPGPPANADEVEDFIGRGLETSILLSAGPGPGDARFRLGETEVHISKILVDADLPFGLQVHETPEAGDAGRDPGAGPGGGPGAGPDRGAGSTPSTPDGPSSSPPPKRYLLQPLLDLRAGYATTERRASEADPGVPFVRVATTTQTYAAGLGLRIELLERWVHLEPRLTFVYGNTTAAARGGDPNVRAQFRQAQHRVLVDWRAETLTLLPIVALDLDPTIGPIGLHGALTATQLRTFTLRATTPTQRRERTSVTLRASLGLDLPIPGFKPYGRQVYLMPNFGYTRLEGDLGQLPDTGRNFFDVTLGIAPDLRGLLPLVGRLGLSFTYVRGENLEGYGWDVVWIVEV